MIADWCVETERVGMGDGTGQESWLQSVKDLEYYAKEPEFDSANTQEPLT